MWQLCRVVWELPNGMANFLDRKRGLSLACWWDIALAMCVLEICDSED